MNESPALEPLKKGSPLAGTLIVLLVIWFFWPKFMDKVTPSPENYKLVAGGPGCFIPDMLDHNLDVTVFVGKKARPGTIEKTEQQLVGHYRYSNGTTSSPERQPFTSLMAREFHDLKPAHGAKTRAGFTIWLDASGPIKTAELRPIRTRID